MIDFWRTKSVVVDIASNLSIRDYLNFIQANDSIAKILNTFSDLHYFKKRIENVLIIYDIEYSSDLLLEDESVLTVFNVKRTHDPKSTVLRIYSYLKPYLDKFDFIKDIDDDFSFDEFFNFDSISSQDKAKILKNLEKYFKMDDGDYQLHEINSNKIQLILKKFIEVTFNDLKSNFEKNEYSIVNLLVETLNILDQEEILIQYFIEENKFPIDFFPETILDINDKLIDESLEEVINDLITFFNEKASIIDDSFSDQLPVMFMYSEKIIDKSIINNFIFNQALKNVDIIPTFYESLMNKFINNLNPCSNAGENYKEIIRRFINLYFEPLIEKFIDETIDNFKSNSILKINEFEKNYNDQAKLEQDVLYKTILTEYSTDEVKSNKFELLSSFTKLFTNKTNKESNEIKFRVNFEMLNKNLKNLKTFINFELSYQILEDAQFKIKLFLKFKNIQDSLVSNDQINSNIQEIFKQFVFIISQDHIKPGFEKAIEILSKYDPNEFKTLESLENLNAVEPLVKFTELINVGDLIQQMIEIFYTNELVSKKIVDKNEFLNNTNQVKKQFEASLDNYVANGLNIGIDKLMSEIEFLFNTLQLINDFNPKLKNKDGIEIINPGPTKCAIKVVELLSNHINLLNGATEKGIIDVFQQEIGERFFQIICKNIKKRSISSTGAIILISDLNYYYDFIVNVLKQKNITPLFVGLKELAQLYLIQTKDSKELGKLISDLNKFNGIFRQEEIYEFVQKRSDWFKIKKDVEKAMYGLGLIDCTIM